jgi:RHS repeat-associated protein
MTYEYDSFGNLSTSTGTLINSLQYTAREFDSETGLFFNRARYYSSQAGRFISADPTGLDGGINVYAYAAGAPTDLIDPFGLRPGDKYPTLKCAGWHAVRDINQTSRQTSIAWPYGREYGGWIYQNGDGTFSYNEPVPGTATSLKSDDLLPIPPGTHKAADYHTHGAYDPIGNLGNPQPGSPGYNWRNDQNEVFSPRDKRSNDTWGIPGFLGTPQGTTEEYIPSPGHPLGGLVIVLNGGGCGC